MTSKKLSLRRQPKGDKRERTRAALLESARILIREKGYERTTLDEVAKEYSGRLKVAKVNVDHNQGIPPKYGIRGIPTLILFKNGTPEATKVGAVSKSQLTAFIDSNI